MPAGSQVRLRGRVFGRSPVVGGSRNSMALTDSGELYTWGWNQRGSLGLGHKQIERVPRKVDALSGLKITQVGNYIWKTWMGVVKKEAEGFNTI